MRRPARTCLALIAPCVVLGACSDDAGPEGPGPSGEASVTVRVVAAGVGPQAAYALTLDGTPLRERVSVDAPTTLTLASGAHAFRLTGLPAWCTTDAGPGDIQVRADFRLDVVFTVTCTGATITLRTEGGAPDQDGYLLAVDGDSVSAMRLPTVGTQVLGLPPGERRLSLGGIAANCTASAESRTVQIDATADNPVEFSVTCRGAWLRVAVTTSGVDRDLNGYGIGVTPFSPSLSPGGSVIGDTETKVVGSWAEGARLTVRLDELQPNCQADAASREVTMTASDTLDVAFAVRCARLPSPILVSLAGDATLYLLGATDYFGEASLVPMLDGLAPRWASGRGTFAFVKGDSVRVADTDAGTVTTMARGVQPALSADGGQLYHILPYDCPWNCNYPFGIYRLDVGAAPRASSVALGVPGVADFDISPDGATIAYVSEGGYYDYELTVAGIDGSAARTLKSGLRGNFGSTPIGPRFSPDGRELYVTSSCPTNATLDCIWILRTDGSSERVLDVRATPLDWSPDGASLLATRAETNASGLITISAVDGRTTAHLGSLRRLVRSASWRR